MGAAETLKSRNNTKIIEQKYIERVLREESTNILRAQDRVISRHNISSKTPEISRRRFRVTGTSAEFVHPLRQRFIDMKYRKGVKQKTVPIHNKVIYNHFNKIVRRMALGFTEDIKNEIANTYNIVL